jgi:hypothetical protein
MCCTASEHKAVFRRRFPNHGVAGNGGQECVPGPYGDRKIEGGNHADDAERVPLFVHPVLNALRMHGQAVQHAGLTDRKIGDIDHLLDFAIAFRFDLPVLERNQAAQRVFVEPQLFRHQSYGLAAFRRRHLAPLSGGVDRSGHHMFIVVVGSAANLREALAGGWVDRLDQRPGLLLAPAADAGPGARIEVAEAQCFQGVGGLMHGESWLRIWVGAAF